MQLIDTHCHLTDKNAGYIEAITERAANCSVTRFICIGASEGSGSARQAIALAEKYPHIWATIGIHPHDADNFQNVDEIKNLAQHPKVVAIGETGLDYFRDWAKKENQLALFKAQIALAKEVKKPLVIHSREAASDCLEILKQESAHLVGGVYHCYAEDADYAKKIRELNFLVSFTGNVTFKKASNIQSAAKEIPLSQIMLETDAPYMAPEPFRGKESEPMHVYQVATKIAELKNQTLEEVARITTENALRLFGLE